MSRKGSNLSVRTVDGKALSFVASSSMVTKELLQKVALQLNLEEYWYFGMRYRLRASSAAKTPPNTGKLRAGEEDYEWMRMEKKVLQHHHLKPNAQGVYEIELRVRYFPESAEFCVADNASLALLFMQVRKALETGVWDVPTGRLGLQFAAMVLQFQFGDWVAYHTDPMVPQATLECYPKAVKEERITSEHEIQTRAANYWQHLFGKDREEVQLLYLSHAEEHVERYGVSYFQIENSRGSKLMLGIDSSGINIYKPTDKSAPLLGMEWKEITKMNVSGSKVELYSNEPGSKPMELVPKDARVAKQILEQAMGALQIYRMYHQTVAEVKGELLQQFGDEEPYIPPIEAVESGDLPPPITEPLEQTQRVVEEPVTPAQAALVGGEQEYVQVAPEPPSTQQISLEQPVDTSAVEQQQPPSTGEREPDVQYNAGTDYLTGNEQSELLHEHPITIQEEPEPNTNIEPEPEPAQVSASIAPPDPTPAPRPSKLIERPPEPEQPEAEQFAVVLKTVQPPQPVPVENRELEEKIQESARKIKEMEEEEKRIKQEMLKMEEELKNSKEVLEKQREQAAQIQSRMLQIVAAEQEDKRRIAEDFDMLITIAAEEKLPVSKFYSVRGKLGTVGRTEWAKMWRQEASVSSDSLNTTRPFAAAVGRYGNKRVSVAMAMERRRPLLDIAGDMRRQSQVIYPPDEPQGAMSLTVPGAGEASGPSSAAGMRASWAGSNGQLRSAHVQSNVQLAGPSELEFDSQQLESPSEGNESPQSTPRGQVPSPNERYSAAFPTSGRFAKPPTMPLPPPPPNRRDGRVPSLAQAFNEVASGTAEGIPAVLVNGGSADESFDGTGALGARLNG